MSLDVAAIVERARLAAAEAQKDGKTSGSEREQLKRVAQEFESMLLVQMLKDMRKAGSWDETDAKDTYGAETMFEMLDVELASQLAKMKGLGLQKELLGAFDRLQPPAAPVAPTTESAVGGATSVAPLPVLGLRPQGSGLLQPSVVRPRQEVRPEAVTSPEARSPKPEAFVKPISGAVTSEFGWRRDPFTSRLTFHQGIDMRAAYGQDVQAAGAGTVVFSGQQGGYGTSVVIEHEDGTRTRYAHLSAALVEKGERVGAGQSVGQAGRSGRATGTHLHFEVIGRDGKRVAPQQWAQADTAGRSVPGLDTHGARGSAD